MRNERFIALDGLRGIAAIAVLLRHFGSAAGPFRLPESHLAVDLFFLLSGFVLAHAYGARLASGMSFWSFAKARLVRLYPLFFLGTMLGAAVAFWIAYQRAAPANFADMTGSFVFNLGFLPSPFHDYAPFPFNGPAWSLFYEMLASLVFALLAPRLGLKGLAVALALGLGVLIALAMDRGTLDSGARYTSFWGASARVTFSFVAGAAFYGAWRRWDLGRISVPLSAPIFLMLAVFAIQPGAWRPVADVFIVVVMLPLILWLGACARPRGRAAKACEILGDLSYPLYALHYPLIGVAGGLWLAWDWGGVREMSWGLSALFALGLIGLAYLAHVYYDAPVRRWLNERLRGARAPSPAKPARQAA